jgi:hypothetical protein
MLLNFDAHCGRWLQQTAAKLHDATRLLPQGPVRGVHDAESGAVGVSILTIKMTPNADTSIPSFVEYITEPWDRPGRS